MSPSLCPGPLPPHHQSHIPYPLTIQTTDATHCIGGMLAADTLSHFLTRVSMHGARGRIRCHVSDSLVNILYVLVANTVLEHLHLLPSLLSHQMSYPLIAMCYSNLDHRLRNNLFRNGLMGKLRLNVLDPNNLLTCWCGRKHDTWGGTSSAALPTAKQAPTIHRAGQRHGPATGHCHRMIHPHNRHSQHRTTWLHDQQWQPSTTRRLLQSGTEPHQ